MNTIIKTLTEKYEKEGYETARKFYESWENDGHELSDREVILVRLFMAKLCVLNDDIEYAGSFFNVAVKHSKKVPVKANPEQAASVRRASASAGGLFDDIVKMIPIPGQDFEMLSTPVTQKLYEAVMGTNPSHFKGDDLLPVESVSWYDAVFFCNKLSIMEGLEPVYSINGKTEFRSLDTVPEVNTSASGYRLPTVEEWKYAARGGENYKYAGSDDLGEVGWYDGNSYGATHPVARKKANGYGLYDMSGNVWEWCSDWYGNYSSSSQTNPTGPNSGSDRVFRGGSWNCNAGYCRSSFRNKLIPVIRLFTLGLRLVLVP